VDRQVRNPTVIHNYVEMHRVRKALSPSKTFLNFQIQPHPLPQRGRGAAGILFFNEFDAGGECRIS